MSWTYSSLKTAIQDFSESTESTFVTHLNDFIEGAEERILKGVELDQFRKNVTGTGTSSNTYLSMPTDFLAPFSLAVIDASSNYNYLKQMYCCYCILMIKNMIHLTLSGCLKCDKHRPIKNKTLILK